MFLRTRLTLCPLEDRRTPAAGALDPTFGQGGRVTVPLPATASGADPLGTPPAVASAVLALPNGQVVLVGSNSAVDFAAVRLNADGSTDTTFGKAGAATVDFGASDFANAGAVQPDGKLLLAGSAYDVARAAGGVAPIDFAVARLLADGRPDPAFGRGGAVLYYGSSAGSVPAQDVATAVAVQPDGKVVVAGIEPDGVTNTGTVLVIRLTAAGALDPTFGVGGAVRFHAGANDTVAGVAVLRDGRLAVAGTTGGDVFLARLLADGSLDPAFAGDGTATFDLGGLETARGLAVQRDGKLVVAGESAGSSTTAGVVARVNPDGSLDRAFGTNGKAVVDFGTPAAATAVALQPNGRIVLAGTDANTVVGSGTGDVRVARLNADGSADATFGQAGHAAAGFSGGATGRGVAVQPDGGLVVAGSVDRAFGAARFVGDPPPTPAGSVLVGGTADGSGLLLVPGSGGLRAGDAVPLLPAFPGPVRVASADVTGDGVADYVAGPGPGGGPNVVVVDGATGAKVANLDVFETAFTGGVFVAAADLNGDGYADVVVTPDVGGGPVVVVYDGAGLAAGRDAAAQVARFYGIEDPDFRGGARPALGDVNGDGTPDLVVAAGFGGGPRVALFDGRRVLAPVGSGQLPPKLVPDFFVFEPTVRNGAFVAAGDLTGDGAADVVAGGGPGGGPRVRALDGRALTAGRQAEAANFFAGDEADRGGVRVAVRPDAAGVPQLVTGSGAGAAATVRVYRPAAARVGGPADQTVGVFGGAALADGVSVG